MMPPRYAVPLTPDEVELVKTHRANVRLVGPAGELVWMFNGRT